MKLVCKKAALAALFLLPLSGSVLANPSCTPVFGPDGVPLPCATELPEPSTPMLFLGALGVGIVARAIRNRKK